MGQLPTPVSASGGGYLLASGTTDGAVLIFDLRTLEKLGGRGGAVGGPWGAVGGRGGPWGTVAAAAFWDIDPRVDSQGKDILDFVYAVYAVYIYIFYVKE